MRKIGSESISVFCFFFFLFYFIVFTIVTCAVIEWDQLGRNFIIRTATDNDNTNFSIETQQNIATC